MKQAALNLTLAALVTASTSHAEVPSVAVDIAPVHSLVAQVMGTLGKPAPVISPGASPHGYSLRPSEARALQDAGLDFRVSAGLTPWLADTIGTLCPDATRLELLEVDGITELEIREGALFEAHVHEKDNDKEILAPARNRNFIVFHDAYHYFENAFNFPASGAISVGDASKPGPARIQQIHDRVAQANVTRVLTEPQFNPDLVKAVLDGTTAQSDSIDPLGSHLEIGPTLYPQLIRELAQTLADCV